MSKNYYQKVKALKGIAIFLIMVLCVDMSTINVARASNGTDMPSIDEAIELTGDNLSNLDNYQKGSYMSWGGGYNPEGDGICSAYYYLASMDSYTVSINDSNIVLDISEYDANGNWIKHNDEVFDGYEFTKQSKTQYIMITVYTTIWGRDIEKLIENGLKIEFTNTLEKDEDNDNDNDDVEEDTKGVIRLNADDFQYGYYKSWGGALETLGVTDALCTNDYIEADADTYIIRIGDSRIELNIAEYDANKNWLKHTDSIYDGSIFAKQDKTKYIMVTFYSNVWGVDIKGLLYDGMKLELEYFNDDDSNADKDDNNDINDDNDNTIEMSGLTAKEFVKAMNVGWNLGDSFDSKGDSSSQGEDSQLSQETFWGNPTVTKELVDYVSDAGFNTIRIPVTWYYNSYTDSDGKLRVREKWLARIQEVVDYAMDNDMYVIINSHHDQEMFYAGVSDDEIEQVYADVESIWTDVADYFKDYDEHLIFESFNEIDNLAWSWNYSDTAAEQMNNMNQIFVDAVRATGGNNSKRILMVPTLLDGTGDDFYNAFKLPSDSVKDRLVVTVHNYSQTFNQDIDSFFAKLESFSGKVNAPIVIGEFGTTDNYELSDYRTIHASNYVARAAAHGIRCIWWDNGYEYALINRRSLSDSKTDLINALLDGSKGIAYEVSDELVYDDISQYVLKMPNLTTGELETQYWGTITTEEIPVNGDKQYMINLTALGGADDIWLQRILFYDASGNYLSGNELQTYSYTFETPSDAAYMKISMNSPYRSVQLSEYTQYLTDSDLQLSVFSPEGGNVTKIILTVK